MTYFAGNHYPAVYYSGSLQIESDAALAATQPVWEASVLEGYSASGRRRRDLLLLEEKRSMTFYGLTALEADRWRDYYQNWGGLGKAADLLVDRYTGRVFTFTNTFADQSTDTLTGTAPAVSYQKVSDKFGLVVPKSSSLFFYTNVGSRNASLTNSEGTIVVTALCSFSGNDGLDHEFFFWGSVSVPLNIRLIKDSTNTLFFTLVDSGNQAYNASIGAVNWPSGTIVSAICQWSVPTSMGLWVSIPGSGTAQATVSLSGSLFTTAISSVFSIAGRTNDAVPLTNAVLLQFATYKKAYPDPTILTSCFLFGRNYYSSAELIDATFAPDRTAPGTDLWQATLTWRQGLP